jgi:DNA adenine methylase (dam)
MEVKPILRWAGSKRQVIPRLAEYWRPRARRYVEPFAGSAALFFHLAPKRALLADINAELINCLKQVAFRPSRIYAIWSSFPVDRDFYSNLRSIQPSELDPTERAARFLYLNRICFNGIYRTNLKGEFNVPFSGDRTGGIPDRTQFLAASRLLRRCEVECLDFEILLRNYVRRGDFVYLDPPYATGARRVFREYDPDSFCKDDLARLETSLNEIDARGATFVMSYAYCPEALQTFAGWNLAKHFCLRNVAGFAGKRRKAAELLVTNLDLP